MDRFIFLILISFTTSLFSAKIGILYTKIGYDIFYYRHEIFNTITDNGHSIEFIPGSNLSRNDEKKFDLLLSNQLFNTSINANHKTILYIFEPPIIVRQWYDPSYLKEFHKVFTFDHAICDEKKFFKGFFPAYTNLHKEFKSFNDRKFVCLINSYLGPFGLYAARKSIALFYNTYFPESLTFFGGRGWLNEKIGIYKGICENKNAVLQDHKFCYCYENWDNNMYYISEKIHDCIMNRCVPIYLGSSKITDYIPKEAFIDARAFKSIQEIHNFISNMDEKTWLTYIHAMEEWDKSEISKFFKKEYYIKSFTDEILNSLKSMGLH